MEQFLRGESIENAIEENIVLKNIYLRENLLWIFLLMGGYLKQSAKRVDEAAGKTCYLLTIPNQEVRVTYYVDRRELLCIENRKRETGNHEA